MTKAINVSRIGIVSAGTFLAFLLVSSATAPRAHAALVLDQTTTVMLASTLSATGNLMGTVQGQINAGSFSPTQSTVLSATLGGIGSILATINSMIGGSVIGLPNTGELPDFSAGLGIAN